MASDLTPGILLLLIGGCSIFLPMLLWKDATADESRSTGRRRLGAATALLSALPMLSIVMWDSLGVPPSPSDVRVMVLYGLAMLSTIAALIVIKLSVTAEPAVLAIVFAIYVAGIIAQLSAPIGITLRDVDSYHSSVTRPHAEKPCRGFAFQPVYAHISDLHITDADRTRDGREPGNARLPAMLDAINRQKPRVLVISGDITDKGTAAEWRLVEQFFGKLDPNIAVFIATGNHDLNQFFGKDPAERPVRWPGAAEPSGLDVEPRIFRAVEFQARHLTAVNTAGINLTEYVKSVPNESNVSTFHKQIAECVMSCIASTEGTPSEVKLQMASCRGLCAHDLRSVRFHYFQDVAESFPTYYIDQPTSTAFIGLTTSLGDSAEVGRNAIGITGRKQINNLRAVLSKLPRTVKHIVLVQHHPPLWTGLGRFPQLTPSDSQEPLWDRFYSSPWFLSVFLHHDVKESEEIFEILTAELSRRRGVDAIVAFGHRHEKSLREIGPVILEEAPNLATTEAKDFGFYLVGATGTSLDVSWCGVRQ